MSKNWQRFLLFLIMAAAVGGSFWFGGRWQQTQELANAPAAPVAGADFSPLWEVWRIIDERFVDTAPTSTEPVTSETRVYGAARGLVQALGDPYSEFLPPTDKKQFDEDIQGRFGGIGIEIGVRDGTLTVIAPLPGTPAARAGLKSGDQIVQINDEPASQLSISESVGMIRGRVGTAVRLKISRTGQKELLEFKLVRGIIRVPTIETKKLPGGIFLIKLFNFSGMAPELFRGAMREFADGGDKLIIDLRGNPGGFFEAAVDIGSWFLPAGTIIATEERSENETAKVYESYGYGRSLAGQPKLAVLIDGGSASASEILAGALRDHGRATLVGEKTFGKGSVQELISVTENTALKLTVAKWLTPKGLSISHHGLEPDIAVKASETEIKEGDDPILEAALKFLNQ